MNFKDDLWYMDRCLDEADKAYKMDEVPVGALIINEAGEIISQNHNLKEKNKNSLHHAEILCIEEASKKISNWRLSNCTLFVTLEPCPMCFHALIQARVSRLVFGAYDLKGGALSLKFFERVDKRFNHDFSITGGLKQLECSKILSNFFKERRTQYLVK